MTIRYFDVHSHLNLSPLSENREEVLRRMREEGVGTITVGTGFETSKEAVRLAHEYPDMLWATVGVHPTDLANEIFDEAAFLELALDEKVVAVGETGLDYFRDQSVETKQKQMDLFRKHIELSQKAGKPMMLHVRSSKGTDDAYHDALEELESWKSKSGGVKANFHFFSGSTACMKDIVSSGFTVSVDGPITFVGEYDEMVRECPVESLMAETDAPFAAPTPYRGKTCEPWMVKEVISKIAELKGIGQETLEEQLLLNTEKFFGISLQ
jgi:TatD DNase family protein